MGRQLSLPFTLLGIALASGLGLAPAAAQSRATEPSILAPKTGEPRRSESPPRTRPISSAVAAQLAAAAPKYSPPPPKPERDPEHEDIDMRDIDKPRNNIIRLPSYIVREPRPPVFNERAIHTKEGLTDVAVRRYISELDRALNRFAIPLFAGWSPGGGSAMENRAMAMYAEQERLDNMASMSDAASTVSKSDAAQGTYILRESQKTYLRNNDPGWNRGVSSDR